jgi:hypothetical protein
MRPQAVAEYEEWEMEERNKTEYWKSKVKGKCCGGCGDA